MKKFLKTNRFRENLLNTSYSFYRSRVLHIGFELGIFQLIGRASFSREEIAKKLKADLRGIAILLNALASLGLLIKRNNRFKNTPEALEVCIPGNEKYVGDIIKLQNTSWIGWQNLAQTVLEGKPFRRPAFLETDLNATKDFIYAMHNTAMGHAALLAERVQLRSCKSLVDIGGGSGAFTVYFLKANPKLRGTIFDLPGTLRVTKDIVSRYGLNDRIAFQEGDFLKDSIKGKYGVAFLSHIIHGLGEADNRKLVKKIFGVLEEGGKLLIQDFFLNDDHTSPEFAALFALNMLIFTEEGRSYSLAEAKAWLKEAGFRKVSEIPLHLPRSIRILRGVK